MAEVLPLTLRQDIEPCAQGFNPPRSAEPHECFAFFGRGDNRHTSVFAMMPARDEPVFFESSDKSRHRRRSDLFGVCELAEGARTGKHEHRQDRETGCGEARGVIDFPEGAQKPDGGGMQPVRELVVASLRGSSHI